MKMRIMTLWVAAALIAGSAVAQNDSSNGLNNSSIGDEPALQNESMQSGVDTVIVASSESHIDATLADSASDRLGVPVVLTDPGSLSDSTSQAMTDLGVERAVIVGGPVALSENVEQEINSLTEDETVRVFGETASDTSVEVADYFWPNGYNQTTVVQARLMGEEDDTYRLISAAANTAEENPLLITEMDETQQEEVVNEVVSAEGVNQVRAYTVDTSTNNSLENSLNQLGIEAQLNQGSVEELSTELYSQIQSNPEDKTMFAVAGTNFEYGIPTYAHPNGVTYTVTRDRVNQSVEYIENSGFTQVNTIGEQDTSNQLTEQLTSSIQEEYIPVDSAADTSVEILEENTEEWATQRNEELLAELGLITMSNESEMAAQNETQTGNETETPAPGMSPEDAQSSLELSSDSSEVRAEASYTSDEPFTQVQDLETNETHIVMTFELVPTGDMPEQDQYNYEFNETFNPDPGEYQTQAELVVNNRVVDTATGTAQIQ